jgi:hypothetical protein
VSSQGLNKYNAINRLLTPEQKNTVKVGGGLFEESGEFKGLPTGKSLFNFPEEKKTRTARGFNEKGAGQINEITEHEDGTFTIKSIPTGFFSKTGTDKDAIFNINAFKKTLSRFEKQFAIDFDNMNKYRLDNLDGFVGTEGNRINKSIDFTEQSLFNVLTPQARNFINAEHFNPLKEAGALDEDNFEYVNRQELKQAFEQRAIDIYGDANFEDVDISKINTEGMDAEQKANLKEEMNALILRQLLVWSKYKFERL